MKSGFIHWMKCRGIEERDEAKVAHFKSNLKRPRGRIISTVVMIAFLIGVTVLASQRLPYLIDIGKRAWIAPYIVSIDDPYEPDDKMVLDLKLNSSSFAAQGWIDATITLYDEYPDPAMITDPKSYFVIFDGTHCTDKPDDNLRIGYACIIPLLLSEDKTSYFGNGDIKYITDGLHPVTLSRNIDAKAINIDFTTTKQPFIAVEPIATLHGITFSKLDVYTNLAAIAFAGGLAIIAIIWVRPSNESKPEQAKKTGNEHDDKKGT